MHNSLLCKGILTILLIWGCSDDTIAQTSVSLKSQWLDPTNLFTEKKPTAEFSTTYPIVGHWSGYFYYAHNIKDLTPIYLIGGFNYLSESSKSDSLTFSTDKSRGFARSSRNFFLSYQYSETVHHLSWIQPILTFDWNFVNNSSKTVQKLTAELSAWASFQRDFYQDGGYISGKYNYSRHTGKCIFNGNLSTMVIDIVEPTRNIFVVGEILKLSMTYLPFKTTIEIVLNKPIITKEDNKLGFTAGMVKEF